MVSGRKDGSNIVWRVLVFIIIGGTFVISFFGDKVPHGWFSIVSDNFFIIAMVLAVVAGIGIFLFSKFKPDIMKLMGKDKRPVDPRRRTGKATREKTMDAWKKNSLEGNVGDAIPPGTSPGTGASRSPSTEGKGTNDTATAQTFSSDEYL